MSERMSKLQRYVERLNVSSLHIPPSSKATEPSGSRLGPGYPAAALPSGIQGRKLQSWCECRARALVDKSPAVTDVLEHWTYVFENVAHFLWSHIQTLLSALMDSEAHRGRDKAECTHYSLDHTLLEYHWKKSQLLTYSLVSQYQICRQKPCRHTVKC